MLQSSVSLDSLLQNNLLAYLYICLVLTEGRMRFLAFPTTSYINLFKLNDYFKT